MRHLSYAKLMFRLASIPLDGCCLAKTPNLGSVNNVNLILTKDLEWAGKSVCPY